MIIDAAMAGNGLLSICLSNLKRTFKVNLNLIVIVIVIVIVIRRARYSVC